jgi:calcineurin-like phosphoesterase family protein
LGDVTFSKKNLPLLARMNGRKVLIKGNHDKLALKDYLPYFDDIRGSHQFDGMLLTHIPVHHDSLARWGLNVHGHLHHNRVMRVLNYQEQTFDNLIEIDPRYFNVAMEQLDDYTPISLEEVKCYLHN